MCPFLTKGRSGSAGSRYGRLRLWLAKERRNGVGEKSTANSGKIAGTASPSRALVAHSGRFRVDDCAVARACLRAPSFTAHGPSARATLLLLITLIAKRRDPRRRACVSCPVCSSGGARPPHSHRISRQKWRCGSSVGDWIRRPYPVAADCEWERGFARDRVRSC